MLVVAIFTTLACIVGAGALLLGKHIVERRTMTDSLHHGVGVDPDEARVDSTVERVVATLAAASTLPSPAPTSSSLPSGSTAPSSSTPRSTSSTRAAASSGPTTSSSRTPSTVGGVATSSQPTTTVLPVLVTTPGPQPTFPAQPTTPRNFLVAASDGHACIDPGSPWASAADRNRPSGDRSDTIMIIRLDPTTDRAAVLSFPRDLWVHVPGRGSQRINAAYRRNQPDRLIQTIKENFDVPVDHYIQVDFCAFKRLVEAVGGLDVPFKHPLRDKHSEIHIDTVGCHHFNGDEALAYVRSRYLEQQVDGAWRRDVTSDYGRIARQQDFLARVFSKLLDRGLLNPTVLRKLIETLTNGDIVTSELSIDQMLAFGGALRRIHPSAIGRYRVGGTGATVESASVIRPDITSPRMVEIFQIFRGERPLDAVVPPEPTVVETTTSAPTTVMPSTTAAPTTRPTTTVVSRTTAGRSTTPVSTRATGSTRPVTSVASTTTTTNTTTTSAPTTTTVVWVRPPSDPIDNVSAQILPDPDVRC